MTTPTAAATETIIHFTRHLTEPGCCGPPPPDPRAARRSPPAATTTWSADSARPASPRSPTSASSASTVVATAAATRGHHRLQEAQGKKLTPAKKQVNQLIAAERTVCEHAFAHLKN
ncbi:hypothetical protein [Streptomyces sp. GESEQ-35]|uniref:hypothetical protein n=1 Tax=Streptomyces sp. GESEQ-35 TaxID=2812657 RepID=UPI001B33535B|nr:hypothetical protein [Streptomyces sp. GESEQ-35]